MSLDPILYVPNSQPWESIGHAKRDTRDALLADAEDELGQFRSSIDYAATTASEIVENLAARKPGWTAENVLKAFMANAIESHKQTNCITEVMFAQALVEARELDRELEETGRIRGPLHGVPVSFKDLFEVKGVDACIGFSRWAHKPCKDDAELVKQVRALGGIPFVKTNVPQTIFSFECLNPLWGRTSNPWDPKRTSGGSTGGEAALLACDGSALGFGTDLGGSLRIPAGYCGLYSLRPGFGRLSLRGARDPTPGFEGVKVVSGPIARSVLDIELACRALFAKSDVLSEALPPLPYQNTQLPSKLRIGYYTSDGFVKASPASQRAVQETVDALQKEGHECVEVEIPNVVDAFCIFTALSSADGHETLTSHIGSDPWNRGLSIATMGPRLPAFLRYLLSWVIGSVQGDGMMSKVAGSSRYRSVAEYWAEAARRTDYRQLFVKEVWERYELDGIICPVQATPAILHDAAERVGPAAITTLLYNLLDLPVGVLPVTRVDPLKDATSLDWENNGPNGSPILFEAFYKGKSPAYDSQAMAGLPVGIQVVGKHWEEEKVIEMMKMIDKTLGPRGFGPGSWTGARGPA